VQSGLPLRWRVRRRLHGAGHLGPLADAEMLPVRMRKVQLTGLVLQVLRAVAPALLQLPGLQLGVLVLAVPQGQGVLQAWLAPAGRLVRWLGGM
jgi:hypothetical protein